MTSKEKAKELVDRYLNIEDTLGANKRGLLFLEEAKQCALICVDEMLKSHYKVFVGVMPKVSDYCQEVKEEIIKL
tara:strand:+ start:157 stop:381 length:225 start_codon:yes stop_codon:yes gene_type:complete